MNKKQVSNRPDSLSTIIQGCERNYLDYKKIFESMVEFKELVNLINSEVEKLYPNINTCIYVKDDFISDRMWFEVYLNLEFSEIYRMQLLDIFEKNEFDKTRRFYIDSNFPDIPHYYKLKIHYIVYNQAESIERFHIYHLNKCFKQLLNELTSEETNTK